MSVDISDLSKLKEIYAQNGFVLVNNVFSEDEVKGIRNEMEKVVENMDPSQHPKSIFDTYDESRHASDQYFVDSASKVSFFYEDGAVEKDGSLKVPKERAINKVGHGKCNSISVVLFLALHWLNPTFKKYSFDKRIIVSVTQ